VRAVPRLCEYTLVFALQLRKKHGITSARVVEKSFPHIPVAVVQYTNSTKNNAKTQNETRITIRILKLTNNT
jgi:hypothetical protein